jgi:HAD superfamily hydrolase (TIGR01509 family)
MTAPPGVLLDVDGTLLDTNHLHALAWWRALRSLGLTYPMVRIHRLIGMGGDKLVPTLVGHEVEGASDRWREEFEALFDEVTPLPGACESVRALHDRGAIVVLASSAPAEHVERFVQVLGVDRWLAGTTSSDDADGSKPEADIFEVAMARHDLDPARTTAIGDTVWDARAARRAGIAFIGVETGGIDARALRDEGAAATYEGVDRLVDLLDGGPVDGPLGRLLAG